MKNPQAEALAELRWYFCEAEADAAGLKAVTWNILEEVDPSKGTGSGPGVKRGAPPLVDPHPDTRSWARVRLRRVYEAFRRCPPAAQSVLEAHFLPHGAGRVPELGREYSYIAAMLPEVQRAAFLEKRTLLDAAQGFVEKEGYPHVLARCKALVQAALAHYTRERFPQLQIPRSP